MAQDIDRKLRLTAALLGTATRKDLAGAFRRVNPQTVFDVTRADKWLQGRARPREGQLYEDWSKVLELDRSGRWVSDCPFEEFVEAVASRHRRDPDDLRRAADAPASRANPEAPGLSLAGTYVAYSHAWSPYFRGQLIRGSIVVGASGRGDRPSARYSEVLPTGPMELDGTVAVDKRTIRIEVYDPTRISQYLIFALFPPTPPVSVLGGLMFGTTLIGPDAQPSVSRVVMVRLPEPSSRLQSEESYLPADASLAEDLLALGLPIHEPAAVDRCLARFLGDGGGHGMDQVPASGYRELIELFDRAWLTRARGGGPMLEPGRDSEVSRFPGRFARQPR
ncbi:MAG: hypothetical protein U1E23_15605 [Reyranellaceae bacterium]